MTANPSCGECGSLVFAFDDETFRVEHRGDTHEVSNLSGWRCSACGDVVFSPDSAARCAAAGDALVLAARRKLGQEIRRTREKLGLTQAKAARLTGGGHNAFSRYEPGEAVPMPSVVNLLRLLDRHPELLAELLEPAEPGPGLPA